ncbi:hypothetical protein LX36DRAFT_584109, partial [Colletotrichum falcatum]
IITNVGLNFYAIEFKKAVYILLISIKEVPIKVYYSISKVKRYYTTLYYVYKIIYKEIGVEPKVTL